MSTRVGNAIIRSPRRRRAMEDNQNYPVAYFFLAAALAHIGRMSEAGSNAETGLAFDPHGCCRGP
jgi:hypothetical protein